MRYKNIKTLKLVVVSLTIRKNTRKLLRVFLDDNDVEVCNGTSMGRKHTWKAPERASYCRENQIQMLEGETRPKFYFVQNIGDWTLHNWKWEEINNLNLSIIQNDDFYWLSSQRISSWFSVKCSKKWLFIRMDTIENFKTITIYLLRDKWNQKEKISEWQILQIVKITLSKTEL